MTPHAHHNPLPIHISPELYSLLTLPAALVAIGLAAALACALIPWS